MIIRFRTNEGMFRVQVEPQQTFNEALAALQPQLKGQSLDNCSVSNNPNQPGDSNSAQWNEPLQTLGVKHGDLFFVTFNANAEGSASATKEKSVSDLDRELYKADGKIARQRTKLCTHGEKGMCEYCQPLEPYDEEHRVEQGIKHMSFHAYLRKLKADQPVSSPEVMALDIPDYSVKKNCKGGHLPWPRGICSKCQPAAITLQLQRYRMVDHVEFSDSTIVNNFIDFWRQSNTQRMGILIGKYEQYDKVPLGIKAVVAAIYEPEQTNMLDGVSLDDPNVVADAAEKAAAALGLQVVGWVFTDLVQSNNGQGLVVPKRHAKSYFLTSLEVLFAARLQKKYPLNGFGQNGTFSSRFVTCVISGNNLGEIDVAAYQVSQQTEQMVAADLITASTNPSVMRIKSQTKTHYVPDIFYKHKNEYNLTVQENAAPAFPVDYLLISLSHGFPKDPVPVVSGFPIANRPAMRTQTVSQLLDRLNVSSGYVDSNALLDFHLLAYLFSTGTLQPDEQLLLKRLIALELEGDSMGTRGLSQQLANGPGFSTLKYLSQS